MLLADVTGPRAGLELIDFVCVALYLVVTATIVVVSSWRQSSTEEFFLGGRRMPWLAVGLSLIASLMSSISYMGVPGELIANGMAMFCQYLAVPFSMLVVLVVWVPFFMRLRMTSAYEYLERRFDYRTRVLGSILFLLLRLGWMSMVMYVGAFSLSEMTKSLVPIDWLDPIAARFSPAESPILRDTLLYYVIGAVGVTATIYTCVGGFRAAIWNDALQSMMLLAGALITLGYVMWVTGSGPLTWFQIASEQMASHTKPIVFSVDPTVRMTIVTAAMLSFFWTICTHGSDQVVLQRYFSTESLAAARRSYIVNALTDLLIGTLLGLCGLALLVFYLQHPTFLPEEIMQVEGGRTIIKQGDKVLPYFFAHQLPAGIGGVILAVLLCDAMQTLVSGVNSISAVFTGDLFAQLKTKDGWLTDLKLARIITIFVGLFVTAIGMLLAYVIRQNPGLNIIDMMGPAFNMFLGPLASLFLIGMFLKCSARTALFAASCGLVISFVWSWWKVLFGTSYQPTITLSTAVPYLSSFAIAWLSKPILDRGQPVVGRDLTWWAVTRGKQA